VPIADSGDKPDGSRTLLIVIDIDPEHDPDALRKGADELREVAKRLEARADRTEGMGLIPPGQTTSRGQA
jgi:hypothetical protein